MADGFFLAVTNMTGKWQVTQDASSSTGKNGDVDPVKWWMLTGGVKV